MSKSNVKVQPKVRISQILEKKKREDPMGLITAQKNGTMAEFLAVELRAAGINPDSVVFGGNPNQNAGGSRTTSPTKVDPPKPVESPTKVEKVPSSDVSNVQASNFYTSAPTALPVTKAANITPSTSPEKTRASPLGSVAKCPVCTKSVYKAEELVALGSTFHKQCFTCGGTDGQGCKRVLMQGGYEQQAGSPYCTACFAKLFKQGAARGGKLSGGSTVQPIADSASNHTLTAATTYEDKSMQPLKSYQNMNVNVTKLTSSYTEPVVKSVPVASSHEEEKTLQHQKSYQNMKVNISQLSSTFKSGAPTADTNINTANTTANLNNHNFEYGFQEQKKASGADRFRAPIGNTAKCVICTKSVFKMEEIVTLGSTWHKQCFTCGGSGTLGCNRVLTQDGYEQQAGAPYCTACFAKLFKQGAARGAKLSTGGTTSANVSTRTSTKEESVAAVADSVSSAPVEIAEEIVTATSTAVEPESLHEPVPQTESIDDDPPPASPPRQSHFLVNKSKTQPTTPENSGNNYSSSTYYSADKNKNASVADKFKAAQNMANKCPCCTKTVYKAEELFANGNFWHQMCFTCGGTGDEGCKRRLNAQNFQLQSGEPYCSACFDRRVKANVQRTSLNQTSPRSARAGEASTTAEVESSSSAATETDASISASTTTATATTNDAPGLFGSLSLADRSAAFKSSSAPPSSAAPAPAAAATNNINYNNQYSDKAKNASVADKFKAAQNMANKCPCCTKTVYKAEEVFANGNFWHQMCFTCGGTGDEGCKRRLNAQNFQLQSGEPYCSACFDRRVKAATQKASVSGRVSDAASSVTTSPRPLSHGVVGSGSTGGDESLNNSVSSGSSGRYMNSSPLKNSKKSDLPKCKLCQQNVYKMEEMTAMEASWHKQCFTCGECQKMLSTDGYEVKNDTPYCLICIKKIISSSPDDNDNDGGMMISNHEDRGGGGVAIDQDEEPDPISDKKTNEDDEVLVVVEPFVDDPDVHFDTSESAANSFHNGSSYTSNSSNQPLQDVDATQVNDDDDDDLEPVKLDDNVDPNNTEIIISGRGKDGDGDDIPAAATINDNIEGDADDDADAEAASMDEYTDVEFNGQIYRGYHLSYEYDFDDKGVIFWIGSKNKTDVFTNPHISGEVTVTMSSCYKGKPQNIVSRTIEGAPNYTENSLNSWIKIDLGPNRLLLADNYSLKHGGSSRGNSMRNWSLQAKAEEDVDDDGWVTLREHYDDTTITGEPDSAATWELDIPEEISDSAIGFRYFRIVQHGPNSNGNNCLFCCGVEFYGVLFEKLNN